MRIAATGDFHLGIKGKFKIVFTLENVRYCLSRLEYLMVDVFLFCGDLSMEKKYNDNVKSALLLLASTPAKYRFMVIGNHDWWYTPKLKKRFFDPSDLKILDGEGCYLEDLNLGVAGVRGWYDYSFNIGVDVEREKYESALKVTSRELRKLEKALREIEDARTKIVLMHFSPTAETVKGDPCMELCGASVFMDVIESYEVNYGCHGHSHRCRDDVLERVVNGVKIFNVACDKRGFTPLIIELNPSP